VNDFLHPADQTDRILHDAAEEEKRRVKSRVDRARARTKYVNETTSTPPVHSDITNAHVFCDDGCDLPDSWHAAYTTRMASDVYLASLFVAMDPRQPSNMLITLDAVLKGLWVVNPKVFEGPSVKYMPALSTPRTIWSSPEFRATHSLPWLTILEIVNRCSSKWTILATSEQWASAYVNAQQKGKPSTVLALVAPAEVDATIKHAFDLEGFIEFIANVDPQRGSLGLLHM
jgi:hypothetical protein